VDYQPQNNNQGIQSLVELGANGHYPLFPPEWFASLSLTSNFAISKSDKEKTHKIINRMCQHRSLDRKRTILYSLTEKEREIFLKVFFSMVEDKLMSKKPELH